MRRGLCFLLLALWSSGASAQFTGGAGGGSGGSSTVQSWQSYSTSFFYPVYPQGGTASGGAAANASTIYCSPGIIFQKMTLAALSVSVTTVFSGGNVQLAVYTSANGRPGALVGYTGSGSTTSLGVISPTFAAGSGTNIQVGPGGSGGDSNLWFCVNRDNTTAVLLPTATTIGFNSILTGFVGSATTANIFSANNEMVAISCTGTNCNGSGSGATFGNPWPATLTAATWTDVVGRFQPRFFYQPFSIP